MIDRDALPHSACHKEDSAIFSVPHAVLDDKMATAAILAVLMWKPDTRSFIYCHHAAQRMSHNHPLQSRDRKTAAHLQPQRCPGFPLLQHSLQAFRNTCFNDHTSGLHLLDY